jgi:hypothetical protein
MTVCKSEIEHQRCRQPHNSLTMSVSFWMDDSRTERARLQSSHYRVYCASSAEVPTDFGASRERALGLRIEDPSQNIIAKTTVYRIIRTLVVCGSVIDKGDGACSLSNCAILCVICPVTLPVEVTADRE